MSVAQVFVGAGDLYVNCIDPTTGLSIGLAGPFECEKFAIKTNTEIKEKTSKGLTTYGQVIGSGRETRQISRRLPSSGRA